MKKITLIFFALFAMKTSFSQTEKGNKFVGGNINLNGSFNFNSSSSDPKSKNFGTSISPEVGYFIRDNLSLGVNGNFGVSRYKDGSYRSNNLNYGAGIFCRKFIPINEKLFFFINSGIAYGYSKSNSNPNIIYFDYVSNSISVNITPGLIYFINKKIAATASVGSLYYSIDKNVFKNSSFEYPKYITRYGINLNSQSLRLGVNYFF